MSQLFRAALLSAAIAGLITTTAIPAAPAQVKKKDDKKDTKKDTKVAPGDEVGVTEVYMAKDGWRFRIKNSEGKSIAIGTIGFEKQADALKAVDMVKTALTKGKVNVLKDEKK